MKRLLLLAGEESGVLYARQIAARASEAYPGLEVRGYGDYGFDVSDLAVMGFFAVLRRLFYFLRVKRTLERAIDAWRPDVVCTVDYPGLNQGLAAYAHRRGIRAVHVVCPQVWAWRQGRIPKIEAGLDHLCCFLPFEPEIFRTGFASFVGHPLLDEIRPAPSGWRRADARTLALLPGSRLGEIEQHMPILLKAVGMLAQDPALRGRELSVIVPAANAKARAAIERTLAKAPKSVSLTVTDGAARAALAAADAAVVASGTATLEAALIGCPTVLVYRVGAVMAFLLRRMIKGTRFVGLANVIWDRSGATGEQPMVELLQERFTAMRVAEELLPFLTDAGANGRGRDRLAAIRPKLSSEGSPISNIVRTLNPETFLSKGELNPREANSPE